MKHSVLVIGLGRFGTAAARELMRLGHDVLAVDSSEAAVNEIAPEVPRPCSSTPPISRRSRASAPESSTTRSWRSAARANRACSRPWRSSSSASATSFPRPGRHSTVPSSNA